MESVEPSESSDFGELVDSTVMAADVILQEKVADASPQVVQAASESQDSFYFVADVPSGTGLLQLNVRLKRDTAAISSRIEKRRRVMYNSYSALLVSLIPSFVSYGMYVNMSNGWALGHESEETVKMWKNIYTGSMILSAGLGVNLAVQIGLFLGAADSVLPERAKSR